MRGLCRRERIAQSLHCSWSKEFLEAGKKLLAGDTASAATSAEVINLRTEARNLKEHQAGLGPTEFYRKQGINDGNPPFLEGCIGRV